MVKETDDIDPENFRTVAEALNNIADAVEEAQSDPLTKRQAIDGFVERHPNATFSKRSTGGSWDIERDYYLTYDLSGEKPGLSNIGSSRSDAEQWLEENGWEISVVTIEEGSTPDRDLCISVKLEETDR